ncbi:LacI family DNA-binding transcriptional regulator [Aeromonas jandaei]
MPHLDWTNEYQRKATLKDVAKLAGVSPITVSRFVNTPSSVSDTTAKKIMDAIEQSGYVPNAAARQLKTSESNVVYFVVPSIKNRLYASISHELMLFLSGFGKSLFICEYNFQDEIEDMLILEIIKHRPAAIIIASGDGMKISVMNFLRASKIPVIQFDRVNNKIDCVATIELDNFHGGKLAGEYLINKGVKEIYVLSVNTKRVFESRIDGLKSAASEYSVKVNIVNSDFNFRDRNDSYTIDLTGNTGYFLLNSDIANSFLTKNTTVMTQVLAERIISFDKIINSDFIPFKIATINYDMSEFVREITQKLDDIFKQVRTEQSKSVIPVNIIYNP